MPLLHYFSNADLNNTEQMRIMFILQHRLPLSIILLIVTPMVIVAGLLFLLFVFIGLENVF
jgi:hypothetical protein